MKNKIALLMLIVSTFTNIDSYAQPFVYSNENTGISCTKPPLPLPNDLTNYPMLPDPFAWSDGSGRSTDFNDWECRRNEIKAEIEQYEIGPKPNRPANITASYANGTLTVIVTENGQTLTLTSSVTIPTGTGPFPVVIGMNSGTGSIPANLFDGVIKIPFQHNQVVTYSQTSNRVSTDPYYKLYPDLTYVGDYSAWAWGVSRIIDGIEIVKTQINADVNHIAVTGCSYAGKMALFAGAFDERIALTIVQESGGGGINAWRVSEIIGNVEKIDNTNYSWFMQSLKDNFTGKSTTLPYDHHELMAMIAPRALLLLGNPDYVWLGDESGYVSARAVEEVYKTFGIEDRFGFSFRGGHNHCSLPADSNSEVQAFIDKFLFDNTTANTNIHIHPFASTDYKKWTKAWAEPVNPDTPEIVLTSPVNNTAYDEPASVSITTTVTDLNNDVVKVEFFNGIVKIGEATTAPYSFTWENVLGGTYFITAEAVDAQDLRGISNVVKVVVAKPTVEIYKVITPPTIDGTIDEIWNDSKIKTFEAKNFLVGSGFDTTDLSGTAKVVWDNSNVYLLAQIVDDVKKNDSANYYEDDGIEYYFDGSNGKTTSYSGDDVQYSFGWNDANNVGNSPTSVSKSGIESVMVDTANGYVVETKIPWANFGVTPVDGKLVGFDFMINDDDDTNANRDGKLSWNAAQDSAWQNTSFFGTIKIVEENLLSANNTIQKDVRLFPNPSKNTIYVQGINNEFEYQITDVNGKLQLSGKTKNSIQIENLSKGIYFLKIIQGSDKIVKKIIKN